MCVDSSLVFKFKMVLLYGLPRTHRSIFSLLTVCVASVPPKCGQKKKLTSSLSVPNDHCESRSTSSAAITSPALLLFIVFT